jgi:hypothetical protein
MPWQKHEARQCRNDLIRMTRSDGSPLVIRHGQETAAAVDVVEYWQGARLDARHSQYR